MNADDESSPKKRSDKASPDAVTVSVDKTDVKKIEKGDADDPKPRIVLTFRSEKSNTKSSNMKIVSNEEKTEEVSPRRSSRSRVCVSVVCDDNSVSPKKDKSQPVSETDESDSSHVTTKRTRRRSRDENIIATAIARKEKSYNEATPGPTQRLSRRIKPTAKVLANEELRIGVESQNHARLGLTDKSPEEGVRTRRSARPSKLEPKPVEKSVQVDEVVELDGDSQDSDMKLQHLCKLGLKAIEVEDNQDTGIKDLEESEHLEDEEEVDDDSEVISKLLEADEDSGSDEDFFCSVDADKSGTRRRPTRRCWSYFKSGVDRSSPVPDDDKTPSRRSSRRAAPHGTEDSDRSHRSLRKRKSSGAEDVASDQDMEDDSYPADGEEGSEAAEPDEKSTIIANCLCEASSNVYADPDELTEPVFCQAIEVVDGVRVGCSHSASAAHPLCRAGPRAPYLLPCALHAAQLARHMCCPACGLFATQGTFYQCSKGHLFHLECGLPYNENKGRAGCPHCGVYSYRWQPVNTDCTKVRVEMHCSNKRIFLPDQREQCTQAYLGFTTGAPESPPAIPVDLLPPPAVLQRLAMKKDGAKCTAKELREAILAGDIDSIVDKLDVKSANAALPSERGGTCAHVAARRGAGGALYALHAARAQLDARDHLLRTPLMLATLTLVIKKEANVDVDPPADAQDEPVNEEDLLKVIRFLVAAGCDVNCAEQSDQATALHVAAQHGHARAVAALLAAPRVAVDARDQGGWTPLAWAAERDHHAVVRLLLAAGADPLSTDAEGNSCAGWAAAAGAARALALLLDAAPAALLQAGAQGDTPLHVAARQGHYACVVILLARGARCDAENAAGERPADAAAGGAVEGAGGAAAGAGGAGAGAGGAGAGAAAARDAILLNMQMKIALKDDVAPYRILSSDISRGREMYPIPVVNSVDEAPAPGGFTYVTRHVTPYPLALDDTIQTLQGCACEDDCSSDTCACVVLGVRSWWRGGRLLPSFPHHDPPMLFDCNLTCSCHHTRCNNSTVSRLLARGSVWAAARVERVGARVGWALASAGRVARGAPVAAYTGELLPLQLADTRSVDTYMFALDVKPDLLEQCSDKTLLCVDARRYGGAARFINHSCRANLAPVRVFTRSRDLRLPSVVLVATSDIQPGEHFTFDYGDKFWSVKSKFMRCECGAPDCRYPDIDRTHDAGAGATDPHDQ